MVRIFLKNILYIMLCIFLLNCNGLQIMFQLNKSIEFINKCFYIDLNNYVSNGKNN